MEIKDYDDYAELFQDEVMDSMEPVDPHNNYSWESLIYGWALGKDLRPSEAEYLKKHILFKQLHGE